ncbi:hypothetical protein [Occultella kanbiaonis]|uniref:hypothetical protein n=1 Tax=Occultella kanbiaonis TaxID=2675754 RepID=UPI0013D815E0|nr:hypothetical protein [Occultella kanbiaonis]
MSSRYAEGTTVSPERSQAEISESLRRYGATGFAFGWEDQRAMIAFRAEDRHVRFFLDLPNADDREFRSTPTGRTRDTKAASAAYEAEVRRRWRSLALAIKAKLEAVSTGITSFEDEFMAHIVLPDGSTVGEHVRVELEQAWRAGVQPPRLLPQIGRGKS